MQILKTFFMFFQILFGFVFMRGNNSPGHLLAFSQKADLFGFLLVSH